VCFLPIAEYWWIVAEAETVLGLCLIFFCCGRSLTEMIGFANSSSSNNFESTRHLLFLFFILFFLGIMSQSVKF
jgi:hypothetical protein